MSNEQLTVDNGQSAAAEEQETFIEHCPECREEAFECVVTDCGQCYNPEWGTGCWWRFDGKCSCCGWEGSFSDSSV